MNRIQNEINKYKVEPSGNVKEEKDLTTDEINIKDKEEYIN